MKKTTILGICSAAAVLAIASSASALTTDGIRVSIDGGSTWSTCLDGGAASTGNTGDSDSTFGIVTTSFSLNNLALTLSVHVGTTGTGDGTASPYLDLSVGGSVNNTGAASSVIIEFSANGFTPVSHGSYITTQTLNGANYSLTETTYFGNNTLFDTSIGSSPSITLTTIPSLGGSSAAAPGQLTAPYSLTIKDVLTIPTGTSRLSADTTVTVPDGGNTMMLLGSALSVLGLGVFRKSRKA